MPTINIEDLIIPKFDDALEDMLDHGHTHYTFPGGRLGTKSSGIGIFIPLLITQFSNVNAVCFRRYANTLKDSVFAEILSGINKLGLQDHFRSKVSPLEIIYKPTGQRILFRGFDEPEKIKSIKMSDGYIGITWYEELDQFPGRKEIRKATQSTMRGGDKFWNFESFNPPITAANWANKDILIPRKDRLITWSNYLDAPREWLGEQAIEEAEHLRETDYRAFRHEYLGEAVGTGGNVFENAKTQPITDKEIESFDRCYYGMDWGWFPDPNHFSEMYYNAAQRKLYIYGEIRCNKTKNEAMAKLIEDWKAVRITADSSEPKSVSDFMSYGFNMRPAIKGPGSVEYSMKWLASLSEIIIDPIRCPHTAKEFLEYEYERNKDGEIISGYPDKDNHAIDSVRYALEEIWKRRGQ